MKFKTIRDMYPQNLRWQLIIGVAMVHAFMMSLFIWDLTERQKSMLQDHQLEHATALSNSIAAASAHWLISHDISGLQELINSQNRYPELIFALITDIDKQVLAHTEQDKIGQYVLDLPEEPAQTLISNNKTIVDMAVPVMMAGKHIGWTRLGVGQQKAGEKLRKIIRDGIFYAIAAIIIGSIIAWFMGRKITNRLHKIQETIREIKTGNKSSRIVLHGRDEAAKLAEEFNNMLETICLREEQLEKNEEELKQVNVHLEQLVKERTEELEKSLAHAQRSENDLKLAQHVANIGSWRLDIPNNILSWSEETYRIWGIPFDTHLTMETFLDSIHQNDLEMVKTAWTAAMAGEPYDIEHRIIVNNSVKWIHEKAEIQLDKNKIPVLGIGTARDITQQKNIENEREKLITKLEKALSEIQTLRGILPICSICKNIRNDEGYYEQIEAYIRKHTGIDFSHTICEPCMKEHFPDDYDSADFEQNSNPGETPKQAR